MIRTDCIAVIAINSFGPVQRNPRTDAHWTCYETLQLLRSARMDKTISTISQRELRNDSGAVLRAVQAGQTLIVTRNGVPVAELRPIRPRRLVPRAVIAEAAARAPRIDADRFRADLDAVIDPAIRG